MKYAECADRKKNHISDFYDFHFSSYGHFYNKNCQFLMNFHDNSTNKRIEFFIRFSTLHIFHENGSKTEGEEESCLWNLFQNRSKKKIQKSDFIQKR